MQGPLQDKSITGYVELIKAFNLAVIQFTMYPREHMLCQQALDSLYKRINSMFEKQETIIFGVVENKLIIDESPMDETNALVARFFKTFQKLRIDSMILHKGLSRAELAEVVTVMAMRPDAIEKKGGIKDIIYPQDIPHVELEKFRYERIGDKDVVVSVETDERVVKLSKEEKLATEKAKKERKKSFYEIIVKYLKGEIDDISTEVDEISLIKELVRNPKKTVMMLLEVGRAIKNLRLVVERLGEWMVDLLHREGDNIRQDLSAVMASLGKKLQEELLGQDQSKDAVETSEALGTIISNYVDKIKVEMITLKFKRAKKKDARTLERITKKVIETREERDDIMPELESRIRESDLMDEAEFEKAKQRINKMELSSRRVEVPEEELRRLYKLEKMLKEEIKKEKGTAAPPAPEKQKEAAGIVAEKEGPLPKREKEAPLPEDSVVVEKSELEELKRASENAERVIAQRVKQATGEITEKVRELSEDARIKDSLLRELSSGLIVVDRDEKVVMMNRAAEELLGISKEEMIGHHILEHIKSEHLLALTKRREGKVELSSPEDRTREAIRSSTAVVEDEDGRPIGMLFVLTDVARQRELERVKEDFFLRLSHHLKDPLKAIQDAMILLLSRTSGEINEEQKRLLTMAKENSEELLGAFTKLLTASDARRGALDITPSTFDLVSLIEGSVDRFSGWAKDKGVIVKKALPKAIVNVTADREKITLVLDNIIANALKATGKGGEVNIMLDSTRDENNKESVLVEVSDTGTGIPSSEIERVFDEFSQAMQREGEFSGLGMGLSIARDIISRHGGKIWIESELGKGSSVKFTLPTSKAES